MIAGAGVWAGALVFADSSTGAWVRTSSARPRAAILFLAGTRERAKRPADDVPAEAPGGTPPIRTRRPPRRPGAAAEADATTEPLPPPEFKPYEPTEGEQLRLGPEDREDAQA